MANTAHLDAWAKQVAALKEQLRLFHTAEATLKRTEEQRQALLQLVDAVREHLHPIKWVHLEQGVAWMNDEAFVEYHKKYPNITATTNRVHREMDVVISVFNLEE